MFVYLTGGYSIHHEGSYTQTHDAGLRKLVYRGNRTGVFLSWAYHIDEGEYQLFAHTEARSRRQLEPHEGARNEKKNEGKWGESVGPLRSRRDGRKGLELSSMSRVERLLPRDWQLLCYRNPALADAWSPCLG